MAPIQTDDQKTSSKVSRNDLEDKNTQEISPTPPLLFSKRLLVAIMLFICQINFQSLRNNMNIAVVEMTSNKSSPQLTGSGNFSITIGPEFDWDSKTISLVNSMIAYGGLFTFPTGFVIDKLGGSVCCAVCTFLSGVTTMLHPIALEQGLYLLLVCRFLTGWLEAIFYASTSEVSVRWYPKKERTTLTAISFNGMNVGSALSFSFCGYLAYRWGWRMVFYATGIIAIVSGVLLQIFVRNRPSQDKWITKKELAYILEETDNNANEKMAQIDDKKTKKNIHILKCILTSAPLWALLVMGFSFAWIFTLLSASLPLYIQDVTHKDSEEVGYITTIPNTVYIFMFPIAGALIDYWKNHSKITMTLMHKILLSIAFFSASILFIATVLISEFTVSLIFFFIIQIFTAVTFLILLLVTVNFSPQYTSHVASLGEFAFALGNIVPQIVIGFIVTNHSIQEWNHVFILTAAISAAGGLIFDFWGSSEPQKWSS